MPLGCTKCLDACCGADYMNVDLQLWTWNDLPDAKSLSTFVIGSKLTCYRKIFLTVSWIELRLTCLVNLAVACITYQLQTSRID